MKLTKQVWMIIVLGVGLVTLTIGVQLKQRLSPKAFGQTISRIEINPGEITTSSDNAPIFLSALAYDSANEPIWSNVTYQWGLSSPDSAGTIESNNEIAIFRPSALASGDLWVIAADLGNQEIKSIRIDSNEVPLPTHTAFPPPETASAPGDTNGDAKIDIFDYNTIISDFDKSGSPGDLNNNGIVDIFDYNEVISNFGK